MNNLVLFKKQPLFSHYCLLIVERAASTKLQIAIIWVWVGHPTTSTHVQYLTQVSTRHGRESLHVRCGQKQPPAPVPQDSSVLVLSDHTTELVKTADQREVMRIQSSSFG